MPPVSMMEPAVPEDRHIYVSKTDMVAALIRELIFTGELVRASSYASVTWHNGSKSAKRQCGRQCGGWSQKV